MMSEAMRFATLVMHRNVRIAPRVIQGLAGRLHR